MPVNIVPSTGQAISVDTINGGGSLTLSPSFEGQTMQIAISTGFLNTTAIYRFFAGDLFAAAEPGVWYDPSDLATLFQDVEGTNPVTTAGQTVALMLDKSGRGNHATQATAAARPTYGYHPFGGRRNLLTYTEQFDNAYWLTQGGSWSAVDGSGFQTFTEDTASSQHRLYKDGFSLTSGQAYTLSARVAYGTRQWVFLSIFDGTATVSGWFDLQNGVVGSVSGAASSTMALVSTGVYDISLTRTAAGTTSAGNAQIGTQSADNETSNWTANGSTFRAARYQLEQSATATAYQRVGNQYDVTEAGVPSVHYLAFDGVDDFMVTPTITPATDKVQVFAGVRKLSDAAQGVVAEMSVSTASNNGALLLAAPDAASATLAFDSKGTIQTDAVATGQASPLTAVVSGLGDIAGDSAAIRVNGGLIDTDTADQGTGNYLAYPLYIGRRGGTALPFNGNIYSLVTRFGANLDATTISRAETYVAGKTGVTL